MVNAPFVGTSTYGEGCGVAGLKCGAITFFHLPSSAGEMVRSFFLL